MGTTRLNITIPESVNSDILYYAKELNQKKSHIITSALDMYFDYLDLKVAQERVDEPTVEMNDFFKELGIDVRD